MSLADKTSCLLVGGTPSRWFQLLTPPLSVEWIMHAVKGAHGTVEFGRCRHMYGPSGWGPGAMGYKLPLLCWDQQSGCLACLETPLASKSSPADFADVICNSPTACLTCRASFALHGSILTFDPGEKAEMARQRSCWRIRGSISSHLWKLEISNEIWHWESP